MLCLLPLLQNPQEDMIKIQVNYTTPKAPFLPLPSAKPCFSCSTSKPYSFLWEETKKILSLRNFHTLTLNTETILKLP